MELPKILSFRYTKSSDAAYIRFREGEAFESVPMETNDDFIFDFDTEDNIIGVEILNYSDYSSSEADYVSALSHIPEVTYPNPN